MNQIDVRAACTALDVTPAELADVCRREATGSLHDAIAVVQNHDRLIGRTINIVSTLMLDVDGWLARAEACEDEWLRSQGAERSSDEIGAEREEDGSVSLRPSDDSPADGGTDLAAGSDLSREVGHE